MERVSCWIMFLNFLNNNQGLIILFELIIALATLGIFIGIFVVTRNYANSTRDLVKATSISVRKAEESIRITKNKEKESKTIFYLEKLDIKNLNIIKEKREKLQNYKEDLFIHISFLDTISFLYINNKLLKKVIYPKLAIYAYSFFLDFSSEIFNLLTTSGFYGTDFNYYENFINFLIYMFEKEKLKLKEYESKNSFDVLIKTIKKIEKRIRK